ncbi:MAG: NAD(P)H-dependent oxidoreductase [Roseivivax sp.]|nr:NAD(P)H-dependent oxidoreductase [Roseivivax sp.]
MTDLSLLGICGALRAASTNRLLLAEAQRRFAPAQYIEANLRLPLFDQDIEDGPGFPPEVLTLASQIGEADAIVISTPEYNKGTPGVLKNALDWVSRVEGNPWKGKPVAIVSAADGRAGGERSQQMLRWCLNPFQPVVLPGPEVFVAQTSRQWDENGRLLDERAGRGLDRLMAALRAEAERIRQTAQ